MGAQCLARPRLLNVALPGAQIWCVLWVLTDNLDGKRMVMQWGGVQSTLAGLEANFDDIDVADVRAITAAGALLGAALASSNTIPLWRVKVGLRVLVNWSMHDQLSVEIGSRGMHLVCRFARLCVPLGPVLAKNCATLGLMCVILRRFLSVNDPEALSLVLHLLNSLAKLEQNLLALLTEGSVTIVGDAIAALGAEPLVIRQCASFLESVAGKCKVGLVQGATAHSVVTLQCVRRPVGWPARRTKYASLCTACKRRSVMTRRSCDHASAR